MGVILRLAYYLSSIGGWEGGLGGGRGTLTKKPLALPPKKGHRSQKLKKLLHGQASFSKDIFQGSLGNFFMIGDSYATVR